MAEMMIKIKDDIPDHLVAHKFRGMILPFLGEYREGPLKGLRVKTTHPENPGEEFTIPKSFVDILFS